MLPSRRLLHSGRVERPLDCLRQTEVEELHSRLREHHVARLQVAVDDSLSVRLVERVRDLDSEAKHLLRRESSPGEAILERLPLEELHDEVLDPAFAPDVVERADMRVRKLRDRAGLALEALAHLFGGGETFRKDFDRDASIEAGVARPVDLAHAARSEQREDLVRPQPGARCQRQGGVRIYRDFEARSLGTAAAGAVTGAEEIGAGDGRKTAKASRVAADHADLADGAGHHAVPELEPQTAGRDEIALDRGAAPGAAGDRGQRGRESVAVEPAAGDGIRPVVLDPNRIERVFRRDEHLVAAAQVPFPDGLEMPHLVEDGVDGPHAGDQGSRPSRQRSTWGSVPPVSESRTESLPLVPPTQKKGLEFRLAAEPVPEGVSVAMWQVET